MHTANYRGLLIVGLLSLCLGLATTTYGKSAKGKSAQGEEAAGGALAGEEGSQDTRDPESPFAKHRKKKKAGAAQPVDGEGKPGDDRQEAEKDPEIDAIAGKDIRIGLGVLTFGPPVLGGELAYTYRTRFTFALESGAFALNLPETKIKSSYRGVHFQYGFKEGGPFYIGIGYAQQKAVVETTTDASIAITDESVEGGAENSESKETITWNVALTQPLIIPEVGWMWVWAGGASLNLGLGVQVPVGTNISVTGGVGPDTQLTQEKIEQDKADKTKQVESYLNTPLPYISLKFGWFFDFW